MTAIRTLDDLDTAGKRVLVRVDLNVPLADGKVRDATRIDRIVGTLTELTDNGAVVVVLSHLGRPKGAVVPEMSLAPLADPLCSALGRKVTFVATDWSDGAPAKAVAAAAPGDILLMENTRFHPGESANQPAFVKTLIDLGDVYVNDAFSAAHRAHASTEGVAHFIPAAAGRAMEREISALEESLESPERPLIAVVGGAKISTKLELIGNLAARVDALIIGGGMANTFLAARGVEVGASLCEHDLTETVQAILNDAETRGCRVILPVDAVVAEDFKPHAHHRITPIVAVSATEMILDVGPDTVAELDKLFAEARTVVWNGPLGAFELPPFDAGTNAAAQTVARLSREGRLKSIAGGGDTVAALANAGVVDDFTYVSTAGGAFLEWLEGKVLPGVKVLEMDLAADVNTEAAH